MPSIQTKAIDKIQGIFAKVEGIESAPTQEKYPNRPDSMQMPLALSKLDERTNWDLGCNNPRLDIGITVQIFLDTLGQGNYGQMTAKAHYIGDNIRDRFRDANTYLYDDADVKALIEESELDLAVDTAEPMNYSGYQVLEYPARTGNFYHGMEVRFMLVGRTEGNC